MQPCLNPATLRQGIRLDTFIDAASGAGFVAVELRAPWLQEFAAAHGQAALTRRLASAGLAVANVGYGVPLRATAAEFEQALSAVPGVCELMAGVGAPGGSVTLPMRQGDGFTVTREETIERLGRLGRLAADHGRAVYIEFLGLHFPDDFTWTKTLGDTLDMMDAIGLPNVGPLIDAYHWHLGGSRIEDLARLHPGAPMLLHINDAPTGDVQTLTDAMRLLPGEGIMDLPAWLEAIHAATGYDGPVSLELFNDDLRALEPADAAQRSYRALATVLGGSNEQ